MSLAIGAIALLGGCAASTPAPAPESPAAPAPTGPADRPPHGLSTGAGDSVSAAPGSPNALFRYRFVQTDPSSSTFTFRDRDLSFYFKPAPDALHFQIENLQASPVWIDWDRSIFYDPDGGSGKTAHATTRYADRFSALAPTQIPGLKTYSDYVLPMDYLVDPAGSADQLHRPLLPEDSTAPQYSDRDFGVDLAFRVEDRPRTYSFHFKVASVIPR